ncbi:unnamed protein product [Linum tenue]|uniref:Uncharacterized protein n=1 Tax=Linum tenue TaxID=586396 RepID=A0AAV0L391_9ROSI|nr:unnamed protein product [Linum tenue]CAI0428930.1 unnamed protein product [Linum tenue]
MPVLSKTCRMAASANDLWGAIFGATYVYPSAMPNLIAGIRVTNRDGVTAGSVREITFGPGPQDLWSARLPSRLPGSTMPLEPSNPPL